MKNFKDKIVWITGASSGIGREMALQSNSLGADVILSSRNKEALEKVHQALPHPEKSLVLPMDMEKPETFKVKVQEVVDRYGRIDLLFNNAGISQRSETHETDMDVDRKLMEVNYFGNVALTKAVLPILRKQKNGHIANVSSLSGKFGFFERSAYAASKHALHGFFESLRLEEANNNIKVTMLCPGPIRTDISKNALNGKGKAMNTMDQMQLDGMSVEDCVSAMIEAICQEKKEVVIAQGKEKMSVKVHALFPNLFYKLILRQKPQK